MFKEEFQKEKLLFTHDHPEDFTRCFWRKNPAVYPPILAYRVFLVIYYFCLLSCLVFARPEKGLVWYKNILYISTWVTILLTIAAVTAFATSLKKLLEEKKARERPQGEDERQGEGEVEGEGGEELHQVDKMPMKYKFMWFIYNMTAANTMVVTMVFWFFLYDPEVDKDLFFVIITTLITTLLLIADYILTAIPFRFFHIYVPCLFAPFYLFVLFIYQYSGGTGNLGEAAHYKFVDWRYPAKPFLFLVIHVALCAFSHCGMCALYFFKLWVKRPNP